MTWNVTVNGTDLSTLGAYVETLDPGFDAPAHAFGTADIPGRMGAVLTGDATVSGRTMTIAGGLSPAALTRAALDSAMDSFKALVTRGYVTVVHESAAGTIRAIDGVVTRAQVTPRFHHPSTPAARFALAVLCPDPTWYDVTARVVKCSTRTAIPLGTAPSAPLLYVLGSATNPSVTYRSANGTVIETMAFTITLGANDFLEVDLNQQTVIKSVAGTRTNGISTLTSGDFFALDPHDGRYDESAYPTLEVSAGDLVACYTRRWL